MGLLSILKKVKEKEKEMRVLLLGLDNAGKTTILYKLLNKELLDIPPTLGFNIESLFVQEQYNVQLWDVGGQSTIRAYWRNYFEETDGLIWVVDSCDIARLELCRNELHKLLQEERLAGASVLILANKQDLKDALSIEKISQVLEFHKPSLHTNRHCCIISCSAITGEGIQSGLNWIIDDIAKRIFIHE